MPSAATVEAFVSAVEAGHFAEAIRRYYAPGATMRENGDEPRVGIDALVANEERILSIFTSLKGKRLGPVMVDGDRVAINWAFEFVRADGAVTRLEEVAWQRWEGDKVVEERFFYDPKQLVPAQAAATA
jgi:hypothetical protein